MTEAEDIPFAIDHGDRVEVLTHGIRMEYIGNAWRGFSPEQRASLLSNPWQLFKPPTP